MKTIKQIAIELNLHPRSVASRFEVVGIKGKKRITTRYYTDLQIEKIRFHKYKNPSYPSMSNPDYYKKQIDIIEIYLAQHFKNAAEISRKLQLPPFICEETIRLYKKRECIIIQSKL